MPAGLMQNTAESGVGFVRNQIIMQTMGVDGLYWLPYLTTMFFFIFFSNITEIIPAVQFPANARFAMPMVLALATWVFFIFIGIKRQGAFHYFKGALIPPGVPTALLILVVPIEFISTFLVRPFSLMVRLFANMLAGHLILVTFAASDRGALGLADPSRHRAVLVRIARRYDRLRDPRQLPSGIHLHDPHRRVHRRCHASRALTEQGEPTWLCSISSWPRRPPTRPRG